MQPQAQPRAGAPAVLVQLLQVRGLLEAALGPPQVWLLAPPLAPPLAPLLALLLVQAVLQVQPGELQAVEEQRSDPQPLAQVPPAREQPRAVLRVPEPLEQPLTGPQPWGLWQPLAQPRRPVQAVGEELPAPELPALQLPLPLQPPPPLAVVQRALALPLASLVAQVVPLGVRQAPRALQEVLQAARQGPGVPQVPSLEAAEEFLSAPPP